jgi:hypothetical protein
MVYRLSEAVELVRMISLAITAVAICIRILESTL